MFLSAFWLRLSCPHQEVMLESEVERDSNPIQWPWLAYRGKFIKSACELGTWIEVILWFTFCVVTPYVTSCVPFFKKRRKSMHAIGMLLEIKHTSWVSFYAALYLLHLGRARQPFPRGAVVGHKLRTPFLSKMDAVGSCRHRLDPFCVVFSKGRGRGWAVCCCQRTTLCTKLLWWVRWVFPSRLSLPPSSALPRAILFAFYCWVQF